MKKYFCSLFLTLFLFCIPFICFAEETEVDSRISRLISTYECGCTSGSYGTMISRYGLVTRSEAIYCKEHGSKYSRIDFYFGFADDSAAAVRYSGGFTFRAYEQFKKGYKEDNDIAYIRFAEPVGDRTGWYAVKAASDKELKNAYLIFRRDNGKENIQTDVSSAAVRDKKILTFEYASGTATGLPVLMADGSGNKTVVGLGVSYNPDSGTGYIRRITPRVYSDMTSDGLFKGSAASSEPSVTSLITEEEIGTGNMESPPADAGEAKPAQEQQTAVTYDGRPEITGCELLDQLSTRSGPGTSYQEPGTFFRKNTWQGRTVRVLKKSTGNGVWWVQVDFQADNGNSYRVWTGKKRVDVDLDKVPQEYPVGDCDIYPTSDTRWGPGGSYAPAKTAIRTDAWGILYGTENGWADVEFYCDDGSQGRIWVPQSAVHNVDTNMDRSGEN